MSQLGHFKQVGRQTGHHATRLILVKVSKRQRFDMTEQVHTHIRLDTNTQHVSPVPDYKIEYRLDNVNQPKHNPQSN